MMAAQAPAASAVPVVVAELAVPVALAADRAVLVPVVPVVLHRVREPALVEAQGQALEPAALVVMAQLELAAQQPVAMP